MGISMDQGGVGWNFEGVVWGGVDFPIFVFFG